jgi:hypothetical protein
VWLHEGRPGVIGQFFKFNVRERRPTKHALHSLMPVPLEAKYRDKLAWTPEQPGIEWHTFQDAPAVAATRRAAPAAAARAAISVNLIDPDKKATELRLAPDRCSSTPPRRRDGRRHFSYLVATDPEAILLVEAFDERAQAGFRYAFARFHYWKLTATLGDRTVWDVEFDPSMHGNTFANPKTIKKVYNSYHP